MLSIIDGGDSVMPIHVSWGNEQKTYTFFQFENKWTWDEYHYAVDQANRLVAGSSETVNALVDVSACHIFPQNLLSNVRSAVIQNVQANDLVIVVTTSRFVETLLRTLEKLTGSQGLRLVAVRTLAEGVHILEEYDRLHRVSPPVPAARSESAPAPAEPTSPRQ